MRLRAIGLLIGLGGLSVACGMNDGGCGPPPVLALGPHPLLATSCAASVAYKGRDYFVGCLDVHPTRMGELFLRNGGETDYKGAREIVGLPRNRLFVLVGPGCGDHSHHVAGRADVTEREYERARSRLGG